MPKYFVMCGSSNKDVLIDVIKADDVEHCHEMMREIHTDLARCYEDHVYLAIAYAKIEDEDLDSWVETGELSGNMISVKEKYISTLMSC